MIEKYIKSSKGSTMIIVLMVMLILSLLGTTLISISVSNFKMKIMQQNLKTTIYLSESGLEQAYELIGEAIEDSIIEGNDYAEMQSTQFIEDELKKFETDEEGNLIRESKWVYINGKIREEKQDDYEEKLEDWFTKGYKRAFNDYEKKEEGNYKSLINLLKTSINYSSPSSDINTNKPIIELVSETETPNIFEKFTEDSDKNDTYIITLNSKYIHENIEKTLQTKFVIGVPDFKGQYYVMNKVKWDEHMLGKVITTEGNLNILGDNVNITGDIYAYGTLEPDEDKIEENGGIVVEGKEVKISGNIYTHGFIHTNKAYASLTIDGNEIICNTLAIQKNADNSIINIEDTSGGVATLYTLDDIELYGGGNSQINIKGNYYGFSYGSSGHDQSSSIVINSPSIGERNGSRLKIEQDNGEGEVVLGGTVYINAMYNGNKYQTGESVALRGNYYAYTQTMTGLTGDDAIYNKSNIEKEYYEPLYLVNSLINEGRKMTAEDKSKYIYLYYNNVDKLKDEDKRLIQTHGVILENVIHNVGSIVNDGTMGTAKTDLLVQLYLDSYRDKYNNYVEGMGIYGITSRVKINDRFTFNQNLGSKNINDGEIIWVNNNEGEDIVIPSNSDIDGLIITRGNVIIESNVNYTGVIIAEGNITIEDDVNLIYDKEYARKKILENENIVEQFLDPDIEISDVAVGIDDTGAYIDYNKIVDVYWKEVY